MTFQKPDSILIGGVPYSLLSDLGVPKDHDGIVYKNKIWATNLYRGYLGTWSVIDSKLYLTSVSGRNYKMKTSEPIFADWVQDTLHIVASPDQGLHLIVDNGILKSFEKKELPGILQLTYVMRPR